MLLRFRVENHRSLRDEQELSLIASSLKDLPENVAKVQGINEDVLRVAAIYGSNASGKTNVWSAMFYMKLAVMDSHRSWKPDGGVPRSPFILDASYSEKPSLYEADLLLEGVRYQYGFAADSCRILREWLFAYPKGKRQTWFIRDTNRERPLEPGKSLTATKGIEAVTRHNSLFLSAAAQNNHPMLKPIYEWFSAVRIVSPEPHLRLRCEGVTKEMLSQNQASIEALLRAADLGILGMDWKEHSPDFREEKLFDAILSGIREQADSYSDQVSDVLERTLPQRREVKLTHQTAGSERGEPLTLSEESSGTRTWFALVGPVIRALACGGLLLVDELDASLHPLLSLEVMRIFNDSKRNPNNAQLIFNTHDTNLLSAGVLRRDQIWFTEKDEEGATHLYPLSDFKPRQHENLERGYLQGRYGAIPFVGSTDFLHETIAKHE